MDFFGLLKQRRSIRRFGREQVSEQHFSRIISAANSAPSAGNLQAYEIAVVRDETKKRELADAALKQGFVSDASLLLVFFANEEKSASRYSERGRVLYSVQDATIAAAYAQLAATALGLASVWVGAFDEKKVKQILGAPDALRPVAILPIGKPAEKPYEASRRKPDELVHENGF